VLAFHLWPTIFAGAPFRLQNICRNSVPPRSRTTTPLDTAVIARKQEAMVTVIAVGGDGGTYAISVGSAAGAEMR